MRRSSACGSNLGSGKNRLGKILIENGNEVDVLANFSLPLCCGIEEIMFSLKSVVKDGLL